MRSMNKTILVVLAFTFVFLAPAKADEVPDPPHSIVWEQTFYYPNGVFAHRVRYFSDATTLKAIAEYVYNIDRQLYRIDTYHPNQYFAGYREFVRYNVPGTDRLTYESRLHPWEGNAEDYARQFDDIGRLTNEVVFHEHIFRTVSTVSDITYYGDSLQKRTQTIREFSREDLPTQTTQTTFQSDGSVATRALTIYDSQGRIDHIELFEGTVFTSRSQYFYASAVATLPSRILVTNAKEEVIREEFYDPDGRLTSIAHYDNHSRISTIEYFESGSITPSRIDTYEYNRSGSISNVKTTTNGRLIAVTDYKNNLPVSKVEYMYNASAKRFTKSKTTTSYYPANVSGQVNKRKEILTEYAFTDSRERHTYKSHYNLKKYDANGNLTLNDDRIYWTNGKLKVRELEINNGTNSSHFKYHYSNRGKLERIENVTTGEVTIVRRGQEQHPDDPPVPDLQPVLEAASQRNTVIAQASHQDPRQVPRRAEENKNKLVTVI